MTNVIIADGSGLSTSARVRCAALTTLLSASNDELTDKLAIAATDGTLRRRFQFAPAAGNVRAKTGSLDGVAALSG